VKWKITPLENPSGRTDALDLQPEKGRFLFNPDKIPFRALRSEWHNGLLVSFQPRFVQKEFIDGKQFYSGVAQGAGIWAARASKPVSSATG
jgi:hypothetical protein